MSGPNDIYRNRERASSDECRRIELEQTQAWLIILNYFLPVVLKVYLADPPSHYVWVDTEGGPDVAWPLIGGYGPDWICLFQDGRLGYVMYCHITTPDAPAQLRSYANLEELPRYELSDLFDTITSRPAFPGVADYRSYRRAERRRSYLVIPQSDSPPLKVG